MVAHEGSEMDLVRVTDWMWELPANRRHARSRADLCRPVLGRRAARRRESGPSGERRSSARHPLLLVGHARYPLRLWLPHRRGGGLQHRRRGGFARRRGIRHQLWVPPARHRSRGRRSRGQDQAAWWTSSSATSPPAWARAEPSRRLSRPELERLLREGAGWAVEHGYGSAEDLSHTEDGGALPGADPAAVSDRAYARGQDQVGTLGSGNHFLEIQRVDEIFDREAAAAYGLHEGQVTVMVHCGSRGFGYQVCEDYLGVMAEASRRYRIDLPDRQLACAPVESSEGRSYLAAMACAANYAWANRQMIMHLVEKALLQALAHLPQRTQPAPRLRRGPQHRQDRDPHGRRPEGHGLRPPERGYPGLRAGPARGACRLPRGRTAGAHPRRHGHGLVRL